MAGPSRAELQRRWAQRGPRLLPGPGPGRDPGLPGAPRFGCTALSCVPSSLSAPSDVTPPLGPGLRKRKYLVEKNTVSFQPVSEPLLEKMLLSSFISRANHLPRCQELRPGEIKYPIILLGRAGRGGEAGTRTKHSFESACPHQRLERPAKARSRATVTSACSCGATPRRGCPAGPSRVRLARAWGSGALTSAKRSAALLLPHASLPSEAGSGRV